MSAGELTAQAAAFLDGEHGRVVERPRRDPERR